MFLCAAILLRVVARRHDEALRAEAGAMRAERARGAIDETRFGELLQKRLHFSREQVFAVIDALDDSIIPPGEGRYPENAQTSDKVDFDEILSAARSVLPGGTLTSSLSLMQRDSDLNPLSTVPTGINKLKTSEAIEMMFYFGMATYAITKQIAEHPGNSVNVSELLLKTFHTTPNETNATNN
jgi:hypothetical protein